MNLYLCAFLIVSYLKTGLCLAGTVLQFACVIQTSLSVHLVLHSSAVIPSLISGADNYGFFYQQIRKDDLSTCILLFVVENYYTKSEMSKLNGRFYRREYLPILTFFFSWGGKSSLLLSLTC